MEELKKNAKKPAAKKSAASTAEIKTDEQLEVAATTESAVQPMEQKPKKSAAKKKPSQAKAKAVTEEQPDQSEAALAVESETAVAEQPEQELAPAEQQAGTPSETTAQEEQPVEQHEQAEQPESADEQKVDTASEEQKDEDTSTTDKKAGKKRVLSKKTTVILSCVLAVILIAVIIIVSVVSCNGGASDVMYTVTFDTLGGSKISSYKLAAGSKIKRPSEVPTRAMSTFDDWYIEVVNSKGVKERQKFEFDTTISQNITLYAGWKGEVSINVEFNPNGGQFANGDVVSSVTVGSQVSEPEQEPTRFGYVFGGWYTDEECDNKYQFSSYLVNDTILYAGWDKSDDFAYISYYGNGELLQVKPVLKDSDVEVPELFSPKDDIVTTGWYTDKNLSKPYTFGKATEDVSLYTTYYTAGLIISAGTVTGYNGDATDVVIPSTYNGTDVTTIGADAFLRPTELAATITSVTLPNTINSIGDRAFHGCQYLSSINLTSNVTYIGAHAFDMNKRLRTVGDMTGVTSLGEYAFNGCEQLRDVVLSNRIESIKDYTFNDCKMLTNVTIPLGYTMAIGEYAFSGCTSLKTVVVESLVISSVGKSAFEGCINLTEVTIKKTIGEVAFAENGNPFAGCRNVTIYVPSALVDTYKNNPNNESFKDKIAAIR